LYVLTQFLHVDETSEDNNDDDDFDRDNDGDNDTLSILGRIFNKATTPPPDATPEAGSSRQDSVVGPLESDAKSEHNGAANMDAIVDNGNDPIVDLAVVSPPKGRGHRYVPHSLSQSMLSLFL
jgi:hypothetical protein